MSGLEPQSHISIEGVRLPNLRRGFFALVTALSVLGVAACAGSADTATDESDQGEGVDYGATKEEYIEALADMEPVQLTMSGSGSSSGHTAERELAFAESIEEWSGGKITFEVVFGQPVAGYGEIADAVSDGRLDIGLEVPVYTPDEYPATNDLSIVATQAPVGPLLAEMVSVAAIQDFAANSDVILDEYRAKGVEPLIAAEVGFSSGLMCTEPIATKVDFEGKQVRAGSSTASELTQSMGGSPVSMQVTETYEALQRNTVDCTLTALKDAEPQGLTEAAPHVTFPTETSFGRSPTAWLAGPSVAELPLAAQQLIFDRLTTWLGEGIEVNTKWAVDALETIEEQGGGIYRLDDEADAMLEDAVVEHISEDVLAVLNDEAVADLQSKIEKWTAIAEEEGFEEFQNWEDLAEAVNEGSLDFDSFSQRMFEEIYLPHRPS